jgi:hypothetical protein
LQNAEKTRSRKDAEAGEIAFDRAGSGQLVLLISGFPKTRLSWNKLVPFLASRFETIAANLQSSLVRRHRPSAPRCRLNECGAQENVRRPFSFSRAAT